MLRVVCILMFTIVTFTRADADHDENTHTINSYEAVLQFVDLQKEKSSVAESRNLSEHDVRVLVDIWVSRFNCSSNTNRQKRHGDHEGQDVPCKQCLNETNIFSILNLDQAKGISEEDFAKVSTVLLYYYLKSESVCTENNSSTYEQILQHLVTLNGPKSTNQTWNDDDLEEILHTISSHYIPTTYSKCFTAHDVEVHDDEVHDDDVHDDDVHDDDVHDDDVHDDDATHTVQENIESVSTLIVTNIILGRCIGKPTAIDNEAFMHEVFELYDNGHGIIDEEGLELLLADLGLSEEHADDHDDHGDDDHGDEDNHEDDDHGHEHRKKRAHEEGHEDDHHDEEGHEDEGGPLSVHQCFTGEELLNIYGVDHETGINEWVFQELCPALIHQITSGVCQHNDEDDHGNEEAATGLSKGQVWGYGFLSVFLISLCAFAGVAVLPCLNSRFYENAIQMLIALAVATLSGDAILHLIPQAVGLHAHDAGATNGHTDHEDHTDEEDHGPLSSELAYVWKCLVAYLAIYLFYLFESMVEMCGGAHTHMHMEHSSLRLQERNGTPNLGASPTASISTQELAKNGENGDEVTTHQHKPGCLGVGALPIMIVLGDTLHNFGDGLAIGASFSTGAGAGISTSIAVFCHELPHELGDFAVLLNAGLGYKKALMLNFCSALSAFLGLIVGILVSSEGAAREWIFAVAAGMFLYVALVDMMPELIHHHGTKGQSRSLLFLLQNIGFIIGAVIILVIALYEDSLYVGL